MADVVLAENEGRIWLVSGDEHVGALLADILPDGVEVRFVTCEDRAAVFTLWQELSVHAAPGTHPWIINPLIADRIRVRFSMQERCVRFSPWSAMLDAAAQGELEAAAAWLAANPAGRLVLRQLAGADPAPGLADLQRLRGQLVLAAVLRAGADAARVTEDAGRATAEGDVDRMDLVTEAPTLPAS